jgi:hypothetical protein
MYPAVRVLIARAEAAGARPVLFLTWGHRDGWPSGGLPPDVAQDRTRYQASPPRYATEKTAPSQA